MSAEPASVAQSTKKVSSFFVWTFAAVGFIAAVVQIISYFGSGSSQLVVRITPHEAVLQKMLSDAVEDSAKRRGFAARLTAEDKEFYCKAANDNAVKEKEEFRRRCESYEAFEAVLSMIRLNDGVNRYVDYEVENTGNSAAKGIRLSGDDINLVEYIPESGETQQVSERNGQAFYSFPDLNPAEKATIRVWSTDYKIDPTSEYLNLSDLPKLTFAEGTPSVTLFQLAPSSYVGVYETLNDFWTPISVLIVLIICTAIGIAVILVLALIEALIKGRPLKAIVSAGTDDKTDDLAR